MSINELIEWKRVQWKIPNYSTGDRCESKRFTFNNGTCWLTHFGREPTLTGEESRLICLNSDISHIYPWIVSFSLKKLDGTLYDIGSFTLKKCYNYKGRRFNVGLLEENKSTLLPSDVLTIICDLKCYPTGESALDSICLKEQSQLLTSEDMKLTELDVLSKDLKDVLADADSCDTVLQVQDKEFKAHKAILIARSTVFAGMFRHYTVEKQTGIINISDCDPASFKEFLEYLYSGKLENVSFDCAVELYKTSDKYNVQELKSFCVKFVAHNLKVENVCDTIVLADDYEDSAMLSAAQNFFNENTKTIFKSQEWKRLLKSNCVLVEKLLIQLSESKL